MNKMKKKSVSTIASEKSDNRLSYLDHYEEILKYKRRGSNKMRQISEEKEIVLSRGVRWFLFITFILLQILMNIDHGTMPAATEEIRKDLKIDDNILGIFGSLVFLGNLIGSLVSLSLINWFNRKFLLIISLLLNSLLLYTFTITNIVSILFANRVMVGIFQSFISIYLPVWCDQFGMRNKKTMMISLIQAGSPVGVVTGYFLTCYIKDDFGWTYSFTIQAILVSSTVLILLFVPSIYFSATLTFRKESEENEINADRDDNSIYKENDYIYNIETHENQHGYVNKNSFCSNLCTILKHKIYMFSALSLASLFFVITAVQYWGSDYMEQVLQVENKHLRLLSFSIVCITSPTLGVLLGGWSISFIGGYESKHSILLCFIYALLACLFSIPAPFMNDLSTFTILLWLVLFFGGAVVPPLTGIIISTLPPHLRGAANSMTSFFSNLFGYLPAPFVYGLINKLSKDSNNRLAFSIIMYYSSTGVFLLGVACYFRYKHFNYVQEKLSITKTLLEEKDFRLNKAHSFKKRESVVSTSNNIAKVFGSYLNLEEKAQLLEEEDDLDDTDKNSVNVKSLNEKVVTGSYIETDDFDNYHPYSYAYKKQTNSPKFNNPQLSMVTPQFNELNNSITNESDGGLVKITNGERYSKEESIFAPKLNSDFNLDSRVSEAMSNINIDIISKPYDKKGNEVLNNENEEFFIIKERNSSEESKKYNE